ncbi:MAG: endonuclease/exonuclease/phosphatase family protein [Chitinophagaceae bacterium]
MTSQSQWQRVWTKTGQLGMFDSLPEPSTILPLREMIVWNVGHPSSTRASAQLEWLQGQDPEVIVLSETAQSEGCEQLQEGLARAGYRVVASLPQGRDYGSIIASKSGATLSDFVSRLEHLPYRAASVYLETEAIEVIGVYVPSRDGKLARSEEMEAGKIARKRGFLESFLRVLASKTKGDKIVCGDFNVIPRNHVPPEPAFQSWEYDFLSGLERLGLRDTFTLRDPNRQDHSWFGHFGDRYRFDYCYVSQSLAGRVQDASFDHSPRFSKLSDHSALRVKFAPA